MAGRSMLNEADTCRTYITPALQAAGWESESHSIAEQCVFADGRIVVRRNHATRRPAKRADYILRYTRDFPIAVVEAKTEDKPAADGLQQAKNYADILGLKFAYATNGREIIEHDFLTGIESRLMAFPTPDELWSWLRTGDKLSEDAATRLLAPANITSGKEPRKYYFDGGQVAVTVELVYELDADGKQLRVISLADYTAEKVRSLFSGMEVLRVHWMDAVKRAETIRLLKDRGIDFEAVAAQAGKPDADPFDLLCHLAFDAPVLTRRQRADRVKKDRAAFLEAYEPEAREILENLLKKYAVDGELQFTLPDVLKVPPISEHGNVNEIIGKFGGADELRKAVEQLQTLLYAA